MDLEDRITMDKYAIGEISPVEPSVEPEEAHISDVYSGNYSICCDGRLTHYDKSWDDGICSKCGEHSGARGGRHDQG